MRCSGGRWAAVRRRSGGVRVRRSAVRSAAVDSERSEHTAESRKEHTPSRTHPHDTATRVHTLRCGDCGKLFQ
jgi:hypothetical protein